MPSTNCIPIPLQTPSPSVVTAGLAGADALEVHGFDGFMNIAVAPGRFPGGGEVERGAGEGLVVRVAKAGAPVAEVGGDDEGGCWVLEVGGQGLGEFTFGGGGGVADH